MVRCLITLAGLPAAIAKSGMSFTTTDPTPITHFFPTSAAMMAPFPIQQPSPIETSENSPGWSLIGTSRS
jgi:hypothetical protein